MDTVAITDFIASNWPSIWGLVQSVGGYLLWGLAWWYVIVLLPSLLGASIGRAVRAYRVEVSKQ